MTTTVTNYGDSLGIQFPKSLWENVHISENDNVEIWVKDNAIVIKRQEDKKHHTTKERIAAFCSKTRIDAEQSQLFEMDWGKPQGKEIW
jgi:antitoxin component of MazEF toxin-antitoxin module